MMISDPFKFDVPSPDDLVSNGLRSSSMASKGIYLLLQILFIHAVCFKRVISLFLTVSCHAKSYLCVSYGLSRFMCCIMFDLAEPLCVLHYIILFLGMWRKMLNHVELKVFVKLGPSIATLYI